MEGWREGWMDGWTDGRMDGRTAYLSAGWRRDGLQRDTGCRFWSGVSGSVCGLCCCPEWSPSIWNQCPGDECRPTGAGGGREGRGRQTQQNHGHSLTHWGREVELSMGEEEGERERKREREHTHTRLKHTHTHRERGWMREREASVGNWQGCSVRRNNI